MSEFQMIQWDKMRTEIENAKDFSVLKGMSDQLKAFEVLAKQSKQSLETQNKIAEYRLRVNRKLGEHCKKIPRSQGQRTDLTSNTACLKSEIQKAGFSVTQANNFEKIAELTDEEFENYVEEVKQSHQELTTVGLVRLAKDLSKEQKREERQDQYQEAAKNFKSDDIQIWHGEFQSLSEKIENESVDLILTDPPYPEEFLPLWQDMFRVADRVLKPSKFLVCYANHQNLDKIFQLINPLKYYWIFKLDFTMKPIAKGRNLIATWKPVLIFQKLPFKKIEDTIEDTIKFDYTERDLHDLNWGQTIAPFEYILDKFSAPNDLIFEPFAGSGTTLLACQNMKRRCIGTEIEEKYVEITKGRLSGNS